MKHYPLFLIPVFNQITMEINLKKLPAIFFFTFFVKVLHESVLLNCDSVKRSYRIFKDAQTCTQTNKMM